MFTALYGNQSVYDNPLSVICVDLDNGETDATGFSCQAYKGNTEYCGTYDDDDFSANTMCCACKETMTNGK